MSSESACVDGDCSTDGTVFPFDQPAHATEWAILQAVAYADVFDYPLTAVEVHRYLVGVPALPGVVDAILHGGRLVPRYLTLHDGYFTLRGREAIVETRPRRAAVAAELWRQALRYGRLIAQLPFVRMVAVTGALAVDNVEPGDDIDYLIVTEPGRLWLCRALVIALVRLAALRGDEICPNYFLSERALVLPARNLFTAHELVQMVPISGLAICRQMAQVNCWTADFLPNAEGPVRHMAAQASRGRPVRNVAEAVLRTPVGGRLEQWEMGRKIRKFNRQAGYHTEAVFSADWCKGHFDGHGERILAAYADRLRTFEQVPR